MPVKTRSQYKPRSAAHASASATGSDNAPVARSARSTRFVELSGDNDHHHPANIKITTSSFLESSKRTYKVYSPRKKVHQINEEEKYEPSNIEKDAIEALLALQEYDDDNENDNDNESESDGGNVTDFHEYTQAQAPAQAQAHTTSTLRLSSSARCMNPMTPVTKYIYRIGVYNINQNVHYKNAYILYDQKTRMFHIHTIISNLLPGDSVNNDDGNSHEVVDATGWYSLPLPKNTLQTKYTTYIDDTVVNYVKTMIIPSDEHDYYIQDDILGIVISDDEYQKKVFNDDASYYDIEDLVYDEKSTETINGFKAYMLVPSRNYWYSPFGAYYTTVPASCQENRYTTDVIDSVLTILAHSTQ